MNPETQSIEDRILTLMGRPDYTPAPLDEIARHLGGKHLARAVRKAMPRLMSAGTVAKVKKNCFCLPGDAYLASGTILFRQSGAARLVPDPTPENPNPQPVNIRAEDTGIALHGDKVLVRIFDGSDAESDDSPGGAARRDSRRRHGHHRERQRNNAASRAPGSPAADWRYGRVIRILERAFDALPGTLKKTRLFWYIIPDDPRIGRDIIVGDPAKTALFPPPREDDKVVVRILEWKQRHLSPVGEIIEFLGKTHTPLAEYKAILYKYHFAPDFPPDASREAAAFPDRVHPDDARGRLDMRHHLTLTIDPDDAKDFDDAISLETLPNGAHRVGVHIADVSHYVRPGTPLDREARARGNSTYLVGTVLPMLPHALSSGLCSLVEGQDRLTKAVFLTYDPRTHRPLGHPTFANTLIRSRKRLTYTQALALLENDNLATIRALPAPPPHQTGHPGRPLATLDDTELRQLQTALRTLWQIARETRAQRFRDGALELETPEIKIYCDPDGYAERATRNTTDPSHQLIEEYMLAANEAVARALANARLPNLSRVHDKPDPEKLNDLRQQLLAAGIKTGDLTKRPEVQKLLATLHNTPDTYPLQIAFLRSMRQACYRATPDGHYGLAKKHYTHFTSPIRRYSDLIEHRILQHHLTHQQPHNKTHNTNATADANDTNTDITAATAAADRDSDATAAATPPKTKGKSAAATALNLIRNAFRQAKKAATGSTRTAEIDAPAAATAHDNNTPARTNAATAATTNADTDNLNDTAATAPTHPSPRHAHATAAPLPTPTELATLAAHLSRTERNSTEAERETLKIKLIELFERELARPQPQRPPHDAIIVEIRNHGLYVELTDTQAYGLVHISTLTDDLYHITHDATALIGRKTRRSYTLGQHVPVTVDRIDRYKRQTDFRIAPRPPKTAAPVVPAKDATATAANPAPKDARASAAAPVKANTPPPPKGSPPPKSAPAQRPPDTPRHAPANAPRPAGKRGKDTKHRNPDSRAAAPRAPRDKSSSPARNESAAAKKSRPSKSPASAANPPLHPSRARKNTPPKNS